MPLDAQLACCREHQRAIRGDVLVEQDPVLNALQQVHQRRLVSEQRLLAYVISVQLEQIECVQHRAARSSGAAQLAELRETVRAEHHRLAINGEALGLDSRRRGRNQRQPVRQVDCVARP